MARRCGMRVQRKLAILKDPSSETHVILLSPYNENFIKDLKQEIASQDRRWDPEDKFWRINRAYLDTLISLCSRYGE